MKYFLGLFIGVHVLIYGLVTSAFTEPMHWLVPSEISPSWSLNRAHFVEHPYTIVTSAFMHGNGFHLLVNMISVLVLGQLLTVKELRIPVIIAYLLGIFTSGAMILAIPNSQNLPTVGASGALFAVMGVLCIHEEFSIARRSLLFPMTLNVGFSLIPGVSWQAHLGGFLAGLAVAASANFIVAWREQKTLNAQDHGGFRYSRKTIRQWLLLTLGNRRAWREHNMQGAVLLDFLLTTKGMPTSIERL